ncbi:hypothetical protein CWR43_02235 [Rhizobium sullae]|uniref:Uncharacterized protein n=1 Tax=Rhizobium sullae TaxID=50338 RepID=A0A2N0DF11_RHISU|nr:hypothetical protein CWR43_02235 [Rhizobium sullae]
MHESGAATAQRGASVMMWHSRPAAISNLLFQRRLVAMPQIYHAALRSDMPFGIDGAGRGTFMAST